MEDHNPPSFTQIEQFCKSVDIWLALSVKNVAAIHCKAGKGRTGTMISCYYIYSGTFFDPFEAMDHFSSMRCKDSKVMQKIYVYFKLVFFKFFKNKIF